MLPVSDYKIITQEKNNNFSLIGRVKVKLVVVSACLLAVLVFAQLIFANNLATDGKRLSEVNRKISELEAQNVTLRAEIAKESSLANLSKKAQAMGFGTPSNIIVP
ncbi:MAG: hypothetical protein NUV69_04645 [Candidatus Curtissbacteria bacterium]|nr:hypothetical protein [Candidatus Curtissbacteria bacterium]